MNQIGTPITPEKLTPLFSLINGAELTAGRIIVTLKRRQAEHRAFTRDEGQKLALAVDRLNDSLGQIYALKENLYRAHRTEFLRAYRVFKTQGKAQSAGQALLYIAQAINSIDFFQAAPAPAPAPAPAAKPATKPAKKKQWTNYRGAKKPWQGRY